LFQPTLGSHHCVSAPVALFGNAHLPENETIYLKNNTRQRDAPGFAAWQRWPPPFWTDLHRAASPSKRLPEKFKRARTCLSFGYGKTVSTMHKYPNTPDGRYFVVAGRLWRMSHPDLAPEQRQQLVERLMDARRQVGAALKARDAKAERSARAAVDATKRALGERGPVWWTDGAPDFNRRLVSNTPYADWHAALLSDGSP